MKRKATASLPLLLALGWALYQTVPSENRDQRPKTEARSGDLTTKTLSKSKVAKKDYNSCQQEKSSTGSQDSTLQESEKTASTPILWGFLALSFITAIVVAVLWLNEYGPFHSDGKEKQPPNKRKRTTRKATKRNQEAADDLPQIPPKETLEANSKVLFEALEALPTAEKITNTTLMLREMTARCQEGILIIDQEPLRQKIEGGLPKLLASFPSDKSIIDDYLPPKKNKVEQFVTYVIQCRYYQALFSFLEALEKYSAWISFPPAVAKQRRIGDYLREQIGTKLRKRTISITQKSAGWSGNEVTEMCRALEAFKLVGDHFPSVKTQAAAAKRLLADHLTRQGSSCLYCECQRF